MRSEALRLYSGFLTAAVVFVVYVLLMFRFTNEDLLEIVVAFMVFGFAPSFMIPYFIGGDNDDTE